MKVNYGARHHALLFGYIAKSVYELDPEEAECVLKEAVELYGAERGRRMRDRAEKDGLPICMGTYLRYREYGLEPGEFISSKEWNAQGDMRDSSTRCPWSVSWREAGLCRYASVYCRNIDSALGRGFDPDITIQCEQNMTDGAPCCHIWFRRAKDHEEELLVFPDVSARARKPWAYHLAHIYSACRRTLIKHYGINQTEAIMKTALIHFKNTFGTKVSDEFLALIQSDFLDTSDYQGQTHETIDETYRTYLKILREELIPATGCTEPIAIAYCSARARELLGALPTFIYICVSGNIIKNVKSVVVPGTNGLKGIRAAAAAGIIAGRADECLQVISHISQADRQKIEEYLNTTDIDIVCADTGFVFDIDITLKNDEHSARVRMIGNHTNIILEQKDDQILMELPVIENTEAGLTDKSLLNVRDIVNFADIVDILDIHDLVTRQIECNSAISEAGLRKDYGANIGSTLLHDFGDDIRNLARAKAAAGSDARMSGCEMPVVILSGSGNQGIAASIPVIEYARYLDVPDEKLYRSLVVASLITVHQKTGIGRLSAFCGATCAGCGAGAGIAYLCGGDVVMVAHTVVNTLAILSGMICDGAKPSCAAKVAFAVEAGILGYNMYRNNHQFYRGDGIVADSADRTIENVGRLAKHGMYETDQVILKIMTEN